MGFLKSASRPIRAAVARARLRWSARKVGIALVYHRVGDRQGTLDEELVARHDVELFDEQVRHLRSHYRVVPASQLLDAVAARRRGERIPAAITFDDDLASHAEVAAPILSGHGLTATFFVCGASTSRPFRFWWERLQDACEGGMPLADLTTAPGWDPGAPAPATMLEAAEVIQRLDLASRAALEDWLATRAGPDPPTAGMRASAMSALQRDGFELGFHTFRHPYLPALDDVELERAMSEGRDALSEVVGTELDTLAYPHGGGDERVAAAARRAGYRAAFTLVSEPATPDANPQLIGRLETFLSGSRFALEVVRVLERSPQR